VLRIRSKLPARFAISSSLRELTTKSAPNRLASSALSGDEEKAVTSQPHLLKNCRARWPRPPIPITATFADGLMPNCPRVDPSRVLASDYASSSSVSFQWVPPQLSILPLYSGYQKIHGGFYFWDQIALLLIQQINRQIRVLSNV